jgi:hypothetical protein
MFSLIPIEDHAMRSWSHWRYALPFVLYLVLSAMYLRAIPPGESPDEPSHLQCIEQVTLYNRIPIIDPGPTGTIWWARERIISGLVCAHMPLYYFVAGYTEKLVEITTHTPSHYEFPPNNPGWANGESPAMFLHSPEFPADEPIALGVLRLESIVLGLFTIVAAGIVAKRLAPESIEIPLVAMVLVAGWPQFVFMSRAINNDALATALAVCTLAVLVSVRRPKRFVAASLLAALAILSKITMVFAAAAVVVVFAIEIVSAPRRRAYILPGMISVALFGLTAALILLQPTLRLNYDWSQQTIGGANPNAMTISYWGDVLYTSLQSGWARLGWMNVVTPDWQAIAWWSLLLIAGAVGAWASWHTADDQHPARAVLIVCGVWLLAILAGYLRINLNRYQPQYRYAFATIPVFAALASVGLNTLLRRFGKARGWLAPSLALTLLLANVWIITAIVLPAYR